MPTRITIECSHCGAKLNLADESKLGKKMKCPKCSEVFVAASGDDDEDLDDDEEERPRSKKGASPTDGRKGSANKSGKKGKGKSAKSGGNLGLIIGGAVGVVVLLGGLAGVLFAAGVFGGAKPDPNQIQVSPQPGNGVFGNLLKEQAATPVPARTPIPDVAKWLPADAEFIVHVRPAEILESSLVKDLLKSLQLAEQINAASAALGFQPTDVESVTIGVAQLEKAQQQLQQAQASMMLGGRPQMTGLNTPALVVVKLKKPITYDDLLKLSGQIAKDQPVQKVQHTGKEFLESTDPKTSAKGGAYLATESVVLLGDSANLKAAIEKGPHANPVRNFGFMDWTDQLTLAFAPQKAGALKQQIATGSQANPMMGMALAPLAEGASGFSLGLTVRGGVEAEIAVGCVDTPKTELITKSLADLASMGRGQYDQSKGQIPPWASALIDQLMSNLKVSGSHRVVVVTTNIPDSAKEQLVQLPAMIMTQMAMNAMLPKPGESPAADSPSESSPGNSSSSEDDPDGDSPDEKPKSEEEKTEVN